MPQNELIIEMGRACFKILGDSVYYESGNITQLSLAMDMLNFPCWARIKLEYQVHSKTDFLQQLVSGIFNG